MQTPLLVTGGLGFIGSAFLRRIAGSRAVVNLDAKTYAADERRVEGLPPSSETRHIDICDASTVHTELARLRPRAVVHFAAETHVTRSETDPETFFRTNVEGTRNILEAAAAQGVDLVIHVSTDEVYGPAKEQPFKEDDKPTGEGEATSPYARSKALADDLARDFGTHLPVVVVRPTNCFGPWQHPEKAIARWTARALNHEKLPVWGDGRYVRDWMFVDDACSAIELLLDDPPASGVYNIGPENEPVSNLEIARTIAVSAGVPVDHVYLTDYDRPDHDRRYSVDSSRIRALGWAPSVDIEAGIRATVDWYRNNRDWWERLLEQAENLYADADRRT